MLDINNEISELSPQGIDKLSMTANELSSEKEDVHSLLESYCDELHQVCDDLHDPHYEVMQGLCHILIEGISTIAEESRRLTDRECDFLKKIPTILSEYVFIPTSKIPDAHLLSHFKNPAWPRPITEDEEEKFLHALMDDLHPDTHNDVESQAQSEETNSLEQESGLINLSDMIDLDADQDEDNELNFEQDKSSIAGDVLDLDSFVTNIDVVEMEEPIEEPIEEQGSTSDLEVVEAEDAEVSFLDFLDKDSSDDSGEEVLDLTSFTESVLPDETSQDDAIEPETTAEVTSEEQADSVDLAAIIAAEKAQVENTGDVQDLSDDVHIEGLTPERQELIGLVLLELDEISSEDLLINLGQSQDGDEVSQQLIELAEQAESIGNAVELIELEGLSQAVRILSGNIHAMALEQSALSEIQVTRIKAWPRLVKSYLNKIGNIAATEEIIEYLLDTCWPDPLCISTRSNLSDLLKSPTFKEEEKVLRQDVANPDDISIALPENVNQELLDGLLQDLPIQAEEFSSSIQNLMEHQDLGYLEVAQRIAHTLKGAGNVVGVKGIANLTHHLEDILEIQSKAGKVPSIPLLNILTDAADCLEAMSEALLGIDDAPDNSLSVFQSILDWANKIDKEGATEYRAGEGDQASGHKQSSSADESDTTKSAADQQRNVTTLENMLRVPVSLADDLLRIAGENLISTSQMHEYIKIIRARYKSLKLHNLSLQQLSFDLEHLVDVQGVSSNHNQALEIESEFDSLEMDQYHELHSMSRRLVEIAADSIELTQVLEKDLSQLNGLVINQDQLQKENEELVLRTRMVSTRTIVARLKRGVKQACRLTGKQVDLEVVDNDTYMDSEVLNSMIDPLMHILRNAVDHGIETSDERKALRKSPRGHIKLTFNRRGEQIVIDVVDDGRGLSVEKIRAKALSTGLAAIATDVTEDNLQKYILHPGFSTREQVSQVSGRGIGLDVVNTKIRELKGSLEISSTTGMGCHFSVALPVSSFSTHSLLVRVRDSVFAISNRGVEEILYPGLGELQQVAQDTMFKVGENMYPTVMVETLLNMPEDRRGKDRSTRPVVLIKDEQGTITAVLVQEVIDSRDVVVKSMGPFIPKIPGIVGATVLGDGSIASVVDLPELLHSTSKLGQHAVGDHAEHDTLSASRLPYVLVVDDSLSARKSLAQFVEDLGLDVRTARDGMEAVSLIDARKPDLILVDMEMPRMNGLELTSHIRANDTTQDMPVIMITSRSTDKHRKTAMEKGVDHYMVKPFAEEELASHINNVLKIA